MTCTYWRRYMRNLRGHRLCDNTPPHRLGYLDFDNSFASSGFSCVDQLGEVDTAISNTDDMSFAGADGIDPRVMSLFDLHVPGFARTHDDLGALDREVKAISTTSRAPHRFTDV
jgi:hypothetical protein